MHLIRPHFKEKLAKDFIKGLFMMLKQYSLLIVFIKAYVVGTHLNCLDLLRQFKLELVFVKHYAPNCLTLTLFDSNTA